MANGKAKANLNSIELNGVMYVRKDTAKMPAKTHNGLKYVIIRSMGAGVFAGYLKEKVGSEVILLSARRIWYWEGATSLSQLAMEGTKKPKTCKFACAVDSIIILSVVEIIDCTEISRQSIEAVSIWES